jgi:Spy/CpxP family protein refolding chaperone
MKRCNPSIDIVRIIAAAILLVQVASPPAQGAQRDDRLPPGENMEMVEWIQIPRADPFHLVICSKAVQRELGLTRDQVTQLWDMEPLFRSALRELTYGADQKSRKDIQRHKKLARSGMDRILKPEQLKRLRQLLLQLHGPSSAMNDHHLYALLKLTDRQAEKMKSLLQALRDNSEQVYHDQEKAQSCTRQKQMQYLLQTLNRKVFELFSEEQKNIYREAEGKLFDFKLESDSSCHD